MQRNFTIKMFDRAGQVLGYMLLGADSRLIDLEHLRSLGAVRVEVGQ